MRVLVAYDLIHGITLLVLIFLVILIYQSGRDGAFDVFVFLAIHVLFMTVTNLGLLGVRTYGPVVALCHSGLIMLSSIYGLVQSPLQTTGGSSPGFETRRIVAVVISLLLNLLLGYVAYMALMTIEDVSKPATTKHSDIHSAFGIVLAMAVAADGDVSDQKVSNAAKLLGQAIGTAAKPEALVRSIRFALQSAGNEAALERACQSLTRVQSPEQIQWLIQAATEVAGTDDLARGYVDELSAKLTAERR